MFIEIIYDKKPTGIQNMVHYADECYALSRLQDIKCKFVHKDYAWKEITCITIQ